MIVLMCSKSENNGNADETVVTEECIHSFKDLSNKIYGDRRA